MPICFFSYVLQKLVKEEICAVEIEDDVSFTLEDIYDIRETDDYPGIRVSLKANYPPIRVPLTVDVTTGDIITPKEIEYTFKLLFDVLGEHLSGREKKVVDIMMTLFNEEYILKTYVENKEKEASEKTKIGLAKKMYKKGNSVGDIADILDTSVKEVEQWLGLVRV